MAKKGRNKKFSGKQDSGPERGFTVVDENDKRVYLSSHPEGISEKDAQELSDGLAIESRVVPIDQLG
jgi:hypothetical protein